MKDEKKDKFENSILNYIEEAKKKYRDLGIEKLKIVDQMEDLRDGIKNLQETLQYHRKKIGKPIKTGKFSNIKNLADASAMLLKEQKEMDTKQIVEALRKGGFKFETEKPNRAIFFAVYRNPNIVKTESGSYKWVEENVAGEEM